MSDNFQPYPTKTGDWSLIIHRVSTTSAEIWFGTLKATLQMPLKARLVLMNETKQEVARFDVSKDHWQRPFSKMNKRFFAVHVFENLTANSQYFLRFDRLLPDSAGEFAGQWQDMSSGEFQTLPNSLPSTSNGYFTIGFGACYYSHRDAGGAALAYKALYENGHKDHKPNVTFLTGDQVYLDIGLDSFSFDPREIRERIAGDYEENWRFLGDIFRRGATWMLPDDHEYWNDYPFFDSLIPTLWPLRFKRVREATKAAATEAVVNIQRSQIVEIIDIGEDLSICLADFRSNRSKDGFIDPDNFQKIVNWARGLVTPGVFVTSQNLMCSPDKTEKNLTDFSDQYRALISALASSGNDIVSLSGDVHFGRIGIADLGDNGARLIEIVSSPLSNLTGLNGIATSVAHDKPDSFMLDLKIKNPIYDSRYFVESADSDWLSGYPKSRTKEHFMTVGFSKNMDGDVEILVNAWLIRELNNGIPRSSFKLPFKIGLRSGNNN